MTPTEQTCFVFAARYTHDRNTGGTLAVVTALKTVWKDLDEHTQDMIVRESHEAQYNLSDWEELRAFAAKNSRKCGWKLSRGHGGEWVTGCGLSYDAEDFGCSSIRTCPNCKRETKTLS